MDTKSAIKLQARRIIARSGIEALSMRKLAARVGIKGPSIYKHYESKETLVAELRAEFLKDLSHRMMIAEAGSRSPHDRLIAFAASYLRFATEEPDGFKLLFMQSRSTKQGRQGEYPADHPYAILLRTMSEYLNEGSSSVSSSGLEATTYGFWALAHGMAVLKVHHLVQAQSELTDADLGVIRKVLHGLTNGAHAGHRK